MRQLPELLADFQKHLAENPFSDRSPKSLWLPVDYILALGGKRVRPVLALIGHEIFDDRLERALPAAMAVEVFHNFSLLHDDIMDAAPTRRGQPTVHEKWNSNTAILSGDAMLVAAYEAVREIRDRKAGWECLRILNRCAREVCEGQQMDMDFERLKDVKLRDYLKMIELKTAVLLGAALEMGATVARASKKDAQFLADAGRLAGIAFQIKDDFLDTFGDPEKFGKQVGGDIIQNKKTFLVIKTLEIASPADKKALRGWLSEPTRDPEKKVEAVRQIFLRSQIPAFAEAEMQRFSGAAFAALEKVNAPDERKSVLKNLFENLLQREH